jgi:uncharacterized DUF497 family protein
MFEYDPEKSEANLAKHGIDFEQAQALWLDDARVVLEALTSDESRSLTIGLIGDRMWAAVHTLRGEATRIISVRRARKEEVEIYVEWQDDQR